jgi:hypothetical protein
MTRSDPTNRGEPAYGIFKQDDNACERSALTTANISAPLDIVHVLFYIL